MEAVNLAGFAVTFVLALVLAAQVLRDGPVSLWGGFLYADHLSALVCLLTASVALVCSVYAVGYLREDERNGAFDEDKRPQSRSCARYYILTPLFVSAMLLVALANNLGVMWVAIEATTLASVFLVTFYGKRHLARSRLEVRHHRRRRALDGAVRHRPRLLLRPPACWAPIRWPALNWSVLAGTRGATRSDRPCGWRSS